MILKWTLFLDDFFQCTYMLLIMFDKIMNRTEKAGITERNLGESWIAPALKQFWRVGKISPRGKHHMFCDSISWKKQKTYLTEIANHRWFQCHQPSIWAIWWPPVEYQHISVLLERSKKRSMVTENPIYLWMTGGIPTTSTSHGVWQRLQPTGGQVTCGFVDQRNCLPMDSGDPSPRRTPWTWRAGQWSFVLSHFLEVSWNRATPKSSISKEDFPS